MVDINEVAANIYLIDNLLYAIPGMGSVYLINEDKKAIVDVGPSTSVPTVLEGIRRFGVVPAAIDYIIVTHIHLDHGGGTGLILQDMPRAKVVVHPECRPEVIALADEVLSTGGICRFAGSTAAEEVIVGTELGIIHRLRKENPDKRFIPASEQAVCPRMKLITLENVLWSLGEMAPEVKVPEEVRLRAKAAVDRMLEVG